MNEITVMLPAFNEENDLEQLVCEWQLLKNKIVEEFSLALKIVVVNDGSKDNTQEIGARLQQEYDNFTLVNHERNKGLGEAVKTGITYILNNCESSIYTCLMDCDNTHNPKYVLDMIQKMRAEAADVVIASRYQKGAEIKGVSKLRLLTSEGAKYVYSMFLRVKNVRDYTCGYRLYNNEMLQVAYKRFGDKLVEERGFSCMAELLYKLYACGAKFAEVPFELRYDFKNGASKMKVIKTSLDSFKLIRRLKGIQLQKREVMTKA